MSFLRNLSNKYEKKLLDTATKKGLDAQKAFPKNVIHKATEATFEFIGNKIADKSVKPNPVPDENLRNLEEIFIPPEKIETLKN